MRRHKPLADDVKFVADCEGIVNAVRSKDVGHKGLVSALNVEITNQKKLTRRNGYTLAASGSYDAVYGTDAQTKLYAVKGGDLLDIDAEGHETTLMQNLGAGLYSWDEDPNNNVYFTSDSGSSGIVTQDGVPLPLRLPIPTIHSVAAIDTDTWEARPFNLGKKYTANQMQLMATYLMDDGRETAPSETVSLNVAPEIRLIRVSVPTGGVSTRIYATAPGGSTYYLVAVTTKDTVTIAVRNMNMTVAGMEYQFPLGIDSFPAEASLLCFSYGRLLAATYNQDSGYGTIYASLPLQYHVFDKGSDFTSISSVPLLLLPHEKGVIIGTSTNIYDWVPPHRSEVGVEVKGALTEIANFGVPAGICGGVHPHNGKVYFWTHRGIASAMPFTVVTEGKFSGDPGVQNHAHLLFERGYVKLVASTVSGAPSYNPWSERS